MIPCLSQMPSARLQVRGEGPCPPPRCPLSNECIFPPQRQQLQQAWQPTARGEASASPGEPACLPALPLQEPWEPPCPTTPSAQVSTAGGPGLGVSLAGQFLQGPERGPSEMSQKSEPPTRPPALAQRASHNCPPPGGGRLCLPESRRPRLAGRLPERCPAQEDEPQRHSVRCFGPARSPAKAVRGLG